MSKIIPVFLLIAINGTLICNAQFVPNDTIPFEFNSNLIVVKATLETGINSELIFDTGAPTIVKKSVFKKIFKNQDSIKFQLGNNQFGNIPLVLQKFSGSEKFKGALRDGIFGSNLISQTNWYLNLQAQVLVANPDFKPTKSWSTVDFGMDGNGRMILVIQSSNNKFIAMLDTGGAVEITLLDSFIEDNNPFKIASESEKTFWDLYGKHKCVEKITEPVDINIGNLKIENQHLRFSCDHSIIGLGFLKHYEVYLAFDESKIYFKPIL